MQIITDSATMQDYGAPWWDVHYRDKEYQMTPWSRIHYGHAAHHIGGGSVLDVGCGEGWFSRYVGGNYIGIDWSYVVIEKARSRFPNRLFMHTTYQDVEHSIKAQWVCAFELFEHMPEPVSFIDSLLRMAIDGVIFALPCGDWGKTVVENDRQYMSNLHDGKYLYHYATYVQQDIVAMFPSAREIPVDENHMMFIIRKQP